MAAVRKNANEVIMFLINGGAYFDFKNRNGLTAVHRAAIAGNSHNIKVRYIILVFHHCKFIETVFPELTDSSDVYLKYKINIVLVILGIFGSRCLA